MHVEIYRYFGRHTYNHGIETSKLELCPPGTTQITIAVGLWLDCWRLYHR